MIPGAGRPRFLVLALAVVALLPAVPSCAQDLAEEGQAEPPGRVLWRGDFERGGLSQWHGVQCKPDRLQLITEPVREGRYAARFEVRPGDDPIDASGERCEVRESVREDEGDESWWTWSTYFPDVFSLNPDETWNIFTQWHARTSGVGGPPVAFDLDGDAGEAPRWPLRLLVRGGETESPTVRRFPLGALEPGAWHDFLFHVKWSSDPSTGFVEVWLNGELVVPKTMLATLYAGSGVYMKQGLYRGNSDLTASVIHDAVRLGTSQAAVELDGERPAPPPVHVTSSLKDGQSVSGSVPWRVRVAGAPVHRVEFYVDGRLLWTERHAPYCFGGDDCAWETADASAGSHTLEVRALALDGRVATASARVEVSIP